VTPGSEGVPTEGTELKIDVDSRKGRAAFGLKVLRKDGSGLVAIRMAGGGPPVTFWAAHSAGVAPNLAGGVAAAQLVIAGTIAVLSYRRPRN